VNWDVLERKAGQSVDVTEAEAQWLLDLHERADLNRLYSLARDVNERLNGRNVSFIHNMNINCTNICEYHCTFCEFKKTANSDEAYILNFKDVKEKMDQAEGSLSEITFQGGLSPEVRFEDVLDLLRQMHQEDPKIHLHAFSPEEIHYYAEQTQQSYEQILERAKDVGMQSMCGTAAEILDEEIRTKICSEKVSADQWCEIVKTAHALGLPSTSTILFGHLEKSKHVVEHLKRIRNLQRETGMITEFIPLLFMPDKTKLGRAALPEIDRTEYSFKMIAVARLYFMNDIRNVQTSWVKLGWENALRSLACGANDLSGTLYSENITREAGGQFGEHTPLETFYSEIRRIGKNPVERDTVYSFQNLPTAVSSPKNSRKTVLSGIS
jgi:5-amino-6-(D-ribitylamino)uracil---L-tyrosine 4-hydroxyphenyl transferase